MKGLFQKDFCIIAQRKTAVLIFFVIMAVMGYTFDFSFLVYYGAMLFGFMAVSTIAYDDDGNGMAYLLTLPVTIKEYVIEKLLFTGIGLLIGWLSGVIISLIFGAVKGTSPIDAESFEGMLAVLFIFAGCLGLYIPIQLKYGAEKSRIVILCLVAVVLALGTLLAKSDVLKQNMESIAGVSDIVIMLAIVIIGVVILGFSYRWSVDILKKREY